MGMREYLSSHQLSGSRCRRSPRGPLSSLSYYITTQALINHNNLLGAHGGGRGGGGGAAFSSYIIWEAGGNGQHMWAGNREGSRGQTSIIISYSIMLP